MPSPKKNILHICKTEKKILKGIQKDRKMYKYNFSISSFDQR